MLSEIATARQHKERNCKLLFYQYEFSQECSFSGSKKVPHTWLHRGEHLCGGIVEVLLHLLHLYDTIPLHCAHQRMS